MRERERVAVVSGDFAWDSFVYLREYVKNVVRAVGMADVHVA